MENATEYINGNRVTRVRANTWSPSGQTNYNHIIIIRDASWRGEKYPGGSYNRDGITDHAVQQQQRQLIIMRINQNSVYFTRKVEKVFGKGKTHTTIGKRIGLFLMFFRKHTYKCDVFTRT